MKMIQTTVLKPHMGPNGIIVQRGTPIVVDETRHKQLVKKGYVGSLGEDGENAEIAVRADGLTNASLAPCRQRIIGNAEEVTKSKTPRLKSADTEPAPESGGAPGNESSTLPAEDNSEPATQTETGAE